MAGGSCLDLREQRGNQDIIDAFGKVLSGKNNYKTVESIPKKMCSGCKKELKPADKFCSDCGAKAQ
ncbi:hypothetical protein HY500_03430 [Candidatus Woesearchaeota archaeon]|nr:hypothetical protein [Candidatus Woesearchaeota archaeon]